MSQIVPRKRSLFKIAALTVMATALAAMPRTLASINAAAGAAAIDVTPAQGAPPVQGPSAT